jgi:hypothetical protein
MPETAITPAIIVPKLAPEPAKPAPKPAFKRASKPASKPAFKPASKQAANRAYKRQISEVIPRNERADAGKAHLEKEDPTHTGNGGTGTECRRSGRARTAPPNKFETLARPNATFSRFCI